MRGLHAVAADRSSGLRVGSLAHTQALEGRPQSRPLGAGVGAASSSLPLLLQNTPMVSVPWGVRQSSQKSPQQTTEGSLVLPQVRKIRWKAGQRVWTIWLAERESQRKRKEEKRAQEDPRKRPKRSVCGWMGRTGNVANGVASVILKIREPLYVRACGSF